jgi:hypothetical protein
MFHEEKFRRVNLYYSRVNSLGVRLQIRAPLRPLNRRTDGAAGQIPSLPVALTRPEGPAGYALRQQHLDVVSFCDWVSCEANQIQRCCLS